MLWRGLWDVWGLARVSWHLPGSYTCVQEAISMRLSPGRVFRLRSSTNNFCLAMSGFAFHGVQPYMQRNWKHKTHVQTQNCADSSVSVVLADWKFLDL